jgi:hypothetical protein
MTCQAIGLYESLKENECCQRGHPKGALEDISMSREVLASKGDFNKQQQPRKSYRKSHNAIYSPIKSKNILR